jgi:hypothetical protein
MTDAQAADALKAMGTASEVPINKETLMKMSLMIADCPKRHCEGYSGGE